MTEYPGAPQSEIDPGLFLPLDGGEPRCPAPELLSASRAGTLPAALQEPVAAHLASCVVCQMLVEALDDDSTTGLDEETSDRILARLRADPPRDRRRRLPVTRWSIAAGVAIVAGASWLAVLWNRAPDPGVELPPASQVSGADASIILAIGPAPLLPTEAAGPAIGSARTPDERVGLLEPLTAYRAGDYQQAATGFAAFLTRNPESAAGHFYLGASELMRKNDPSAIAALQSGLRLAAAGSAEAEHAAWYLALAYVRTGQIERAAGQLTALCKTGGDWSRMRACTALAELRTPAALSGVVTDTAGNPLGGVLVGEHRIKETYPEAAVSAFTAFAGRSDAQGRFAISGAIATSATTMVVRAVRPGYFTAATIVPHAPEMRATFTLHPWVLTDVNQTLRGTTAVDPICHLPSEPCRRYAVTTPANGLLEVSVTTSDRAKVDLWLELPDGSIVSPMMRATLRLAAQAEAGATYQIQVLSYNEPRDFELSIRLK
jgi:hypothetical protein